MDNASPLLPKDERSNRRNDEADAEILSEILNMPGYDYRRVWGILRKQRRTEGLPPVNAKRLYRIMSEHNLLLLHAKTGCENSPAKPCSSIHALQ